MTVKQPEGHVWCATGDCCVWCGVRRVDVAVPRLLPADKRFTCPGGPDTNIRAISHLIALQRVAQMLHWDRPYTPPVA